MAQASCPLTSSRLSLPKKSLHISAGNACHLGISYDFLVGSNKVQQNGHPKGHMPGHFHRSDLRGRSAHGRTSKLSVGKTWTNHQLQTLCVGILRKSSIENYNHQLQKSSRSFDVTCSAKSFRCDLGTLVQVFPWSQRPSISPSGTWPMWHWLHKTGARCLGPMEKHGGDLSGCCKGSRSWETQLAVRCCEVVLVQTRSYMDHTWIMMADLNSDSYHDLFLRFPETFRRFRLAVPHKSSDLAPSKVGLQAQRDSGQKLGMHRL